ncbi:MAG: hypothetical protein ACOX0O_09360 [Candidatus Methanoculleus thermohydrogenotrophicum]
MDITLRVGTRVVGEPVPSLMREEQSRGPPILQTSEAYLSRSLDSPPRPAGLPGRVVAAGGSHRG